MASCDGVAVADPFASASCASLRSRRALSRARSADSSLASASERCALRWAFAVSSFLCAAVSCMESVVASFDARRIFVDALRSAAASFVSAFATLASALAIVVVPVFFVEASVACACARVRSAVSTTRVCLAISSFVDPVRILASVAFAFASDASACRAFACALGESMVMSVSPASTTSPVTTWTVVICPVTREVSVTSWALSRDPVSLSVRVSDPGAIVMVVGAAEIPDAAWRPRTTYQAPPPAMAATTPMMIQVRVRTVRGEGGGSVGPGPEARVKCALAHAPCDEGSIPLYLSTSKRAMRMPRALAGSRARAGRVRPSGRAALRASARCASRGSRGSRTRSSRRLPTTVCPRG